MGIGGGKIRQKLLLAMLIFTSIAFISIGGTYAHEQNNQTLNISNTTNINLITEKTNNNANSDPTVLNDSVSNIDTTDTTTYKNSDNDSSTEDSADLTQSSNLAAGQNDYASIHGIWVTSTYALKLNVNSLLKMGITDVYIKTNIYSDPKYKTILPKVVKMFKNSGIRVNAWITCFKDANGKWIDPKNTKHNNQLLAAIADITKKYGVDGINLDYIRYPGTAYKYSGSTTAITSFVHKVYDKVKSIKAKVAVSANLMPDGSLNAKYYGQDYNQLSKYLDYLVPMIYKGNYGKTTAWVGTTTKYIVSHANGKPVIVGLQTYKSDSNLAKLPASELKKDIKAANDNGASGYVLFRYGLIDPKFSDSTEAAGSPNEKAAGSPTSTGSLLAAGGLTTSNSVFSITDIKNAANSVQSFIETNHRLPEYVTIANQELQVPAFLKLLVDSVVSIKSGSIVLDDDYQDPTNPSETLKNGNIKSAEYLKMAKSISTYMDSNGEAPNYATSSLGNVRYESLVYMYSRLMNFDRVNSRLPSYVSMTPWKNIALSSSFNQYLVSTKNCEKSNAQIKALAASITKGKTSIYDKAVAIFNYVRDKIGYSFYYNSKYGAVGTLKKKTGNCCDTAHLLIALERAVGIPARYVHVKAKFTSGVFGHVYAQVFVNGKWYTADATSSRNSFGVVRNWSSSTLKGIYASLPF